MNDEKELRYTGARNPYALAEAVLQKKINWEKISNPKKLLENTLRKPYAELFDPKYGSPIFPKKFYDEKAKQFKNVAKTEPPAAIEVGANPPNTAWVDIGDYFEEYAELTDPIQGVWGNCWLIAALASVAWTRPYVIAQRTRQQREGEFCDMIEYFAAGTKKQVECTEKLLVWSPSNAPVGARSSDAGEIWPGMYEKSMAKYLTNSSGDTPDMKSTEYNNPVWAMQWLTGLTPYYYDNINLTVQQIWDSLNQNCTVTLRRVQTHPRDPRRWIIIGSSGMPYNPMTAATYGSGDEAPDRVDYNTANVVGNHAYSIVGTMVNGWPQASDLSNCYVVLRNPWGQTECNLGPSDNPNSLTMVWAILENGYWRTFNFATPDGIFAIKVADFKKYWACFGVVK